MLNNIKVKVVELVSSLSSKFQNIFDFCLYKNLAKQLNVFHLIRPNGEKKKVIAWI